MRIDLKVDTRGLKLRTEREMKRLAYNTAQAINDTTKEVQLDERANLDRKFTLRKPEFMYRLIKIFKWASPRQGRAYAEIGVDRSKKRTLLSIFERGGDRPPAVGKRVAVPVTGGPARPDFAQSVVEAFKFAKLRLRPRGRGTKAFHPSALSSTPQLVGQQGTFQIPGRGIFQRVDEKVRAVYLYVRRPKLDPTLDFIRVARRTINTEFQRQFARAYQRRK